MTVPKFLETDPTPTTVSRLYHGIRVPLWQGMVRLSNVHGWADNPRLELEMKRWKSDYADMEISQGDLYEMMKSTKSIGLKELAANIVANGLREPIVLAFDGTLLDGNRRYFAVQFAYDNEKDPGKKELLQIIPAFVLMENATNRESQHILVEENFSPSLKREWPDYVKAQHIRRAREEKGWSVAEIAAKYGWTTTKVRDTLKIGDITDAFITYATGDPDSEEGGLGLSDLDAVSAAADNYQYFNEAKKSLHNAIKEDADFAELLFTRIAQGYPDEKNKFFNRFDEVRCAYDGYKHAIGRPVMEGGAAGGGKDLKALIQMDRSNLRKRQGDEERILEFVQFLKELSAEQMRTISDAAYGNLREALSLVQKLVEAAKKPK